MLTYVKLVITYILLGNSTLIGLKFFKNHFANS